ncbi:hypothetical protein CYMTET_23898 [Cymbomonas tetramitiformis]|uniref:3'-5' exonuclease domain-containing protein n=1 Tax=Cymbomonas tetramitiformis TaxID=36881 RepID=A0AAE0L0R7_9CHLO|nr:hypothetical protein CYMTET_23898 [Cymbomonas tetramitiformis]
MAQAIQKLKLVPKPKRPDFIPSTKFGPISDEKITLVDSPETLLLAYNTLFVDSAHREATGSPSAHLFPIGLDCEWLPFFTGQDATPVAILQVVSREHAFLIDMLHWCRPAMEDGAVVTQAQRVQEDDGQGMAADGEYAQQLRFVLEEGQGEAPVVRTGASAPYDVLNSQEVLLNAFVHALFSTKHVTLVGFQFGYDMFRLQTSYPHLPVFGKGGAAGPRMAKKVVEVLEMARAVTRRIPRKRRVSLKELHQRILVKPIDKAEQMSNWAQRPLTMAQMRYAAFDGHSVVEMLDVLALRKPALATALRAIYQTAAMRQHKPSFHNTPKSKTLAEPRLPPHVSARFRMPPRTKQRKRNPPDQGCAQQKMWS